MTVTVLLRIAGNTDFFRARVIIWFLLLYCINFPIDAQETVINAESDS